MDEAFHGISQQLSPIYGAERWMECGFSD